MPPPAARPAVTPTGGHDAYGAIGARPGPLGTGRGRAPAQPRANQGEGEGPEAATPTGQPVNQHPRSTIATWSEVPPGALGRRWQGVGDQYAVQGRLPHLGDDQRKL